MSIRNKGLNGIGGITVIGDVDDVYSDITVIEQVDMIVSRSYSIATRYERADNMIIWVRKEIGLNADGETIYIKTFEQQEDPPVFVQVASGVPL